MSSEAFFLCFTVVIFFLSSSLISSSLLDVWTGLPVPVLPGLGEAGAGHSSGPAGSAGGAGHQGGPGSPGTPEPHHWAFPCKTMRAGTEGGRVLYRRTCETCLLLWFIQVYWGKLRILLDPLFPRLSVATQIFDLTLFLTIFPVSLASGCGVEGRPLDHGLSAVCSVQAVGGGGASRTGDGRRPTATSWWRGRGGEFDCQTDVAPSDTSAESHCRYNDDLDEVVDKHVLNYILLAFSGFRQLSN